MKISETEAYKRYVAADHNPSAPCNRIQIRPVEIPHSPVNVFRPPSFKWSTFGKSLGIPQLPSNVVGIPKTRYAD
jgi:hypothetical protein